MKHAPGLSGTVIALLTVLALFTVTPCTVSADSVSFDPADRVSMDGASPTYDSGSIDPRNGYHHDTDLMIAQSLKAVTIEREIAEGDADDETEAGRIGKAFATFLGSLKASIDSASESADSNDGATDGSGSGKGNGNGNSGNGNNGNGNNGNGNGGGNGKGGGRDKNK